jgi:hypothetical protein
MIAARFHTPRLAALGLLGLLAACVVGAYDDGGGYGPGYYEPAGAVYGGWGPDFAVAPYRGGHPFYDDRGNHPFRAAPAGRGIPSLPRGGHAAPGRGGGRDDRR